MLKSGHDRENKILKRNSIRHRLLASTMVGGATLFAMTAVSAATLLAPTAVMAQSQTGTLRVSIVGSDGQPLPGASVRVSSPDSLISRSGTTDAEGRVRLLGLDPATNYTVEVTASGYDAFSAPGVAVVSGRELAVGYALGAATVDDIVVTGRSLAAVDVTSATVGTTLTLDVVESLPTGRSYQSYLQLVPGVKPSTGGNPSSRSGVNYSDIGGTVGSSSDNLYYLDGVDVTDHESGTFGANFNSEIIQEQQVIVGGVPAEYAGGSGLISRVVTKSGGNDWSGSVNYYFQNDTLMAEDKHSASGGFSTYDTAFTVGGPILRDRLWFFASYQKLFREDEVLNPDNGEVRRTVERTDENTFLKATWQITPDDRLVATYFSDPAEITGSRNANVLNNRDQSRVLGGDNFKIDYSRSWGNLLLNAYMFRHEGEESDLSVDKSIRNTVAYRIADDIPAEQRSRNGAGVDLETHKDREEVGINAEYFLDTSFGTHTFKAGFSSTDNTLETIQTIPGGFQYNSLGAEYAGTTFAQYIAGSTWTNRAVSGVDRDRIREGLAESPTALAVLDTDDDGAISAAEINAYQFTSTAGNPHDQINVYRAVSVRDAPYTVSAEGQALYLQDTWTWNQLTLNAGLRGEKWDHYASNGSRIADFDWTIAPRLSMVYDLQGDGRSKVFGFVGRYYDPIRTNMADFAGAIDGPILDEQLFIGGEWVTFRSRGPGDAIVAPTTKTPYTDEFMFGASKTFGSSIGLSATVTHRRTRDILEDYDLSYYSDPNGDVTTGHANADSLFYIPLSYFGFDSAPDTNYVLGTLVGGKRNYTGVEVTLTKYKTDNWAGQISYTHNRAEGNTNSDSNADFQGDWIALDPRAPNAWGEQPGNIKHQVQAYASYDFDFGLQVSGVLNWNSGALYTPAQSVSSRNLPLMVEDPYYYGGVLDTWFLPGLIGSETAPSYYTFDMRLKYVKDLPVGGVEFFLDVFNVLNKQSPTSVMGLDGGNGIQNFGEATAWVAPRRAYLGVRYAF